MADEREFLEPQRVRQVLLRYCGFLPVAIRFAGEVVNDLTPLWTRPSGELNDEDYRSFNSKLYPMAEPPLFWIHLNVDYPFNLRGVLYFPRLATEFDAAESRIKLFCNQVFVPDNCPELIPEFLVPLQGCLDAADLPLNVSRSMLQNEPQVRKIQELVAGRVAGKLVDLSYPGSGGGGHLTRGAGIPQEDLPKRILASTEKDFRFYMTKWIVEKKNINPEIISDWKVIPESWWEKGRGKDYMLLFGDEAPVLEKQSVEIDHK